MWPATWQCVGRNINVLEGFTVDPRPMLGRQIWDEPMLGRQIWDESGVGREGTWKDLDLIACLVIQKLAEKALARDLDFVLRLMSNPNHELG